MMKRSWILVVLVCLMVGTTIGVGQVTAQGLPEKTSLNGQITQIIKNNHNGITIDVQVQDPNSNFTEFIFHINSDTVITDTANNKLTLEDIKEGISIEAVYGPAVTMSLPPQSYASKIVINDQYTGPWATAAKSGITFRAIGQEPAWTLEVAQDQQVKLLLNYGQTEINGTVAIYKNHSASGMQMYYVTSSTENYLVIIQEKTYTDPMSGEKLPYTVTLIREDQVIKGGGRQLN